MSHFDACVIDEAHLIPQWGGTNFRDAYMHFGRLRSSFPTQCSFLATTATATPDDVSTIERVLRFSPKRTFYHNIGNNRWNICHHVQIVRSPNKYDEIKCILDNTGAEGSWSRTMIFGNSVRDVQSICCWLQEQYPEHERQIDTYFARRRRVTKRKVMRRFREGEMKILVTTEAAGMV